MVAQTVTKGTAPGWTRAADGATNRLVGFSYDATGNVTWMPNATGYEYFEYDAENRLVRATYDDPEFYEQYRYGLDNRRLWRARQQGEGNRSEWAYFYGAYGEPLGGRIYFGGRLIGRGGYVGQAILTDRLGSVGGPSKYYLYGQERQTTPQETEKFATYYRDSTGLDYAWNRYYSSSWGRFLQADPYRGSAALENPQSWNRYAYVQDDPVNFNDPEGLIACGDLLEYGTGKKLRDLMGAPGGGSETGLLAQVVWAESYRGGGGKQGQGWLDEKAAIAMTVINRKKLLNYEIFVLDDSGTLVSPTSLVVGPIGADIRAVIGAPNQFRSIAGGPQNPRLTSGFQINLNRIMNTDISLGRQVEIWDPVNKEWYRVNEECADLIQSYVAANLGIRGELTDPFAKYGGLTLGFNTGGSIPAGFANFGRINPDSRTQFWGLQGNWYHAEPISVPKPVDPRFPLALM